MLVYLTNASWFDVCLVMVGAIEPLERLQAREQLQLLVAKSKCMTDS